MPVMIKQTPTQAKPNGAAAASTIPGIVSAKSLVTRWWKVCLYGKNRVGKSTLAVQWPKPLLYAAAEPADNAGSDSIAGMEGVDISMIGIRPYPDPTGYPETMKGSAKALWLASYLMDLFEKSQCPYKSVALDATAIQGIILAELMGWNEVGNIQKWASVPREVYFERADKTREVLRKFASLPCNVIFVCQEKDHNPQNDGTMTSKLLNVEQSLSFMAASLGGSTVEWLHDACGCICQLYQQPEIKSQEIPVVINGIAQPPEILYTPTGKFVRRLRTMYDGNHAAGIRHPKPDVVPQYIEAVTPGEMYEELIKVLSGSKSAKGKYI